MKRILSSRKGKVAMLAMAMVVIATVAVAPMATAQEAQKNGKPWILGKLNNTATKTTGLIGKVATAAALQVTNKAGGTALDLRVLTGVAPLTVNSTTKVANLNADLLDDKDSTDFLAKGSVRADGNIADSPAVAVAPGATAIPISKTFTAPSDGFVMVTGSVGSVINAAGIGVLGYQVRVDGVPATSDPLAYALNTDSTSIFFDSGAVTAVVPVTAGSHTVDLQVTEFGNGSAVLGRSVTANFVPAGSGNTIPVSTESDATSSQAADKVAEVQKKASE